MTRLLSLARKAHGVPWKAEEIAEESGMSSAQHALDLNYDPHLNCSERQMTWCLLSGASCGILRSVPIKVRSFLAPTAGIGFGQAGQYD